jgi:serine/threonine protein phosphatase PrpC
MPSGPGIHAFAISQPGPVRRTNEDCCLADQELGLFVVADGMGGHAAGEVALQLAVDSQSVAERVIAAVDRKTRDSITITALVVPYLGEDQSRG